MRVVVAPDSFGSVTPALAVAEAIATGWHEEAAGDHLELAPLSDGGPGFLSALAAAVTGSEWITLACCGPTGRPRSAEVLRVGSTVYVESALACGLGLVRADGGDVRTASTYGVGDLVAGSAALDRVDTVVVGLGGSGTNDGGAGLWAALGAEPADGLRHGGAALRALEGVRPPLPIGARLVAASDVDNPLLGLTGASATYGPQKGADQAAVLELDAALERWADLVRVATGSDARERPGAGAAGGLGFGLLALGAERTSGIELVLDAAGLAARIESADLVVTGEGRVDPTTLRGKVAVGVAALAAQAGVPCVVVAGQAEVGGRDAAAHGIDELWTVSDLLGSPEAALDSGLDGIRRVAREVARAWSRSVGRG
jgi:glycerate 2-kinase